MQWANSLTQISIATLLALLAISSNRFYDWLKREGQDNKHNGQIPKSSWLTPEEKQAIIAYHAKNLLNGYRRLCHMMIDEDIAYCSPNSVYRTLKQAGLLDTHPPKGGSKGQGFDQPTKVNEHWHVDISYLNVCGTFYYLCSVLDGYSRYIVHHEIRETMKEDDVEVIIQRALELSKERMQDQGQDSNALTPRIISDCGPQFIAKDFKLFIKLSGMSHVRTSPYYPQSNGKIERWHRELKVTYRSKQIGSAEEAKHAVSEFVDCYNHQRLHGALGYVTPLDKYLALDTKLKADRKRKLAGAAQKRRAYWTQQDSQERARSHEKFRHALA